MNKELVIIAKNLLDISMTSMSVRASDEIIGQTILILEQSRTVRDVVETKNDD